MTPAWDGRDIVTDSLALPAWPHVTRLSDLRSPLACAWNLPSILGLGLNRNGWSLQHHHGALS